MANQRPWPGYRGTSGCDTQVCSVPSEETVTGEENRSSDEGGLISVARWELSSGSSDRGHTSFESRGLVTTSWGASSGDSVS